MAKPKNNAPTALTPRSNKAKRKRLRERRKRVVEVAQVEADPAALQLARARRNTRNPKQTLRKLASGELSASDIPAHSYLRSVGALIEGARRKGAACGDAAARLAQVALDLLQDDPAYRVALEGLIRRHAGWVRQPESFVCRTRNAARRFSALLRHLFARYPVPALFDKAWTLGGETYQDWFVRLGRGENLRKVPGLPFPLTKRMAHHVLQAPTSMSLSHALRFGWALGLGARPYVARAILGTRLANQLPAGQEPFWREVLSFFGRQSMLSPQHYGPIVDYLHAQRFVIPPGATAPLRPQLSMTKRELPALLREVEAWHARLGRIASAGKLAWPHQPLVNDLWLRETEHGTPASSAEEGVEFQVVQLLNSAELIAEGRALRHCVATYARGCAEGRCSIWSVRRVGPHKATSLATVELHHRSFTVIQARAKSNTVPGRKAWTLIDRWVHENGLSVSRWVPRG